MASLSISHALILFLVHVTACTTMNVRRIRECRAHSGIPHMQLLVVAHYLSSRASFLVGPPLCIRHRYPTPFPSQTPSPSGIAASICNTHTHVSMVHTCTSSSCRCDSWQRYTQRPPPGAAGGGGGGGMAPACAASPACAAPPAPPWPTPRQYRPLPPVPGYKGSRPGSATLCLCQDGHHCASQSAMTCSAKNSSGTYIVTTATSVRSDIAALLLTAVPLAYEPSAELHCEQTVTTSRSPIGMLPCEETPTHANRRTPSCTHLRPQGWA